MALFWLLIASTALLRVSGVSYPPARWTKAEHADPTHLLRLTVGLVQRNVKELKDTVAIVSDPKSEEYGRYLTVDALTKMVAPEGGTTKTVSDYFRSIGATSVQGVRTQDFLEVDIAVGKLEEEFGVPIHNYVHQLSGRSVVRASTRDLKFPVDIWKNIDVITGLYDFFESKEERLGEKAVAPKTTNSSAPDIVRLSGGYRDVAAHINLYCRDGAMAQHNNHQIWCSDASELQSLKLMITPRGYSKSWNLTFQTDQLIISFGRSGQVETPNINIPEYTRLKVEVQARWEGPENGYYWTSEVGSYLPYYTPVPYVFPSTVFERYNVPKGYRVTNTSATQSVTAFEKQYISLTDLSKFQVDMGLRQYVPTIHGENDQSSPGGESTLDIQYVTGVGAGAPTTFWSVSGPVRDGAYILEWAMQVLNATDSERPLVTSISYGDTELGYFNNYGSWDYIQRMNTELAKMAALGMTVMAGAGDAGSSNVGEAGNDLSPTDPTCTPYRPFFPSNSPFVTSVSSTMLSKDALPICMQSVQAMNQPAECDELGEVAVSIATGAFWTTGGGFSNLTFNERPKWQEAAVAAYLNSKVVDLPPTTGDVWNPAGRGYPDVSTLGHNLIFEFGGETSPVGGTSASGPVLAGLVSLLNNERLNAGLSPLGLLNPMLYTIAEERPEAFYDVTVGSNGDGDLETRGSPYPSTCPNGFQATAGWDPVTGLGTPNWSVLRDYVLSLP